MTELTSKKQGFKKCRSATFSIDGFSFTIVANEAGDSNRHPLARFARSRSQNILSTAVTAAVTGITEPKGIQTDPRSAAEILAEELPTPDAPDAMEKTAIRLRCLIKQLERGEASVADLKKNLEYTASVLEALYNEETRRLAVSEDELSDIQSDSVPSEVRDWLSSTFTRQRRLMLRRTEDKPRFRSIVHAVQAGIFVERMYRRSSNLSGLIYPQNVITVLKHVDTWSFDVFALNDASGDHALKFVFYDLLTRYDLINRFKHWLTELEIFAIIFAAAIHDFEHTGTTNNFHVQTRSDAAMLYNDRAVLENYHISAAFRLLQGDDEMNILTNLSKDDWRELRTLVVEMVLATDMSCHFQQIKAMKSVLQLPEAIDKPKALSLLLHTADISHPAKNWDLHHRWTTSLLEEFFRQGDKEAELGLPFSPLCDRKSTMVAQSQIGFIDFIVEPTFTVLTEMTEKIVTPLIEEASHSGLSGFRRSSFNSINGSDAKNSSVKSTGSEASCCLTTVDFKSFRSTWNQDIDRNRETWKAQAAKDLEEKGKKKAKEGSQEEKDIEEEKQSRGPNTGQEEMKTDLEEQEDVGNRRQEQERHNNPSGAAGSPLVSSPKKPDKKKPGGHTERQWRNGPPPDFPLIHHCKRPSYSASSFQRVRSKVNEMRPIDARGKARRLQRISLRRQK
ncbi:calcium/calmodulin-dependent 3',5'-cyclic nucleotide phosphodiesterase 1C [Etheostoma cragini]|uniref:calcium/calmodulin-dependent 3',5'-cyclic nucleotide phosphodiesterase 1C n=1 Tax=Etheostoma cragini TaxID=417921 RepID=UPI00155ED530|nr:calcium/calmodulin-dependent 3',5'-cyclic nucleotide phosphodiesterase 1C [Etheostoma cragini]